MLQTDEPGDYVIATGETHSVREFAQQAFALLDLDLDDHLRIDEAYLRPAEVGELIGDASKARRELAWQPTVGFDELVRMMVDADLDLARREKAMRDGGLVDRDRLETH
jgi:GDPmannose 4,6-dehydratase